MTPEEKELKRKAILPATETNGQKADRIILNARHNRSTTMLLDFRSRTSSNASSYREGGVLESSVAIPAQVPDDRTVAKRLLVLVPEREIRKE